MALDTREKRANAVGFPSSIRVLPAADGSVSTDDRWRVAYTYPFALTPLLAATKRLSAIGVALPAVRPLPAPVSGINAPDRADLALVYRAFWDSSGAITLWVPTVSGQGEEVISGSGTATTPSVTASGAGHMVPSGSGALTTPSVTASGSGTSAFTGSGALTTPSTTASGAGHMVPSGEGALVLWVPSVAAQGNVPPTGTAAITLWVPEVAGEGHAPVLIAGQRRQPGVGRFTPSPAGSGRFASIQRGVGRFFRPGPGTGR